MTDGRFDVSNNNVDALDGHTIKLKLIWRESIVWNYDICILFSGLNILFKGWLGLVLVSSQ